MTFTKLFKIGEESFYGEWRLTLRNDVLTVRGIDLMHKLNTGEEKVMEEKTFDLTIQDNHMKASKYLKSVSTYHWENVMFDWVYDRLGCW